MGGLFRRGQSAFAATVLDPWRAVRKAAEWGRPPKLANEAWERDWARRRGTVGLEPSRTRHADARDEEEWGIEPEDSVRCGRRQVGAGRTG